jgi:acyl carrier protein
MENTSAIEQPVREFILSEFLAGEDPSELKGSTPLITTGILDSIATLKLVLFLEKEFSINIEPHEANAQYMDTIDRIVELVQSKR